MIACTFLGHNWCLDADLEQKLRAEVIRLLEREEKLEFLFWDRTVGFQDMAYKVVQGLKPLYPAGSIYITLATWDANRTANRANDRIVHVEKNKKHLDPLICFALEHAQYLLLYHYDILKTGYSQEIQFARRLQGLTVIESLASDETNTILLQMIRRLTPREQFILMERADKKTYLNIAAQLERCPELIRQIHLNASKKIERMREDALRKEGVKVFAHKFGV